MTLNVFPLFLLGYSLTGMFRLLSPPLWGSYSERDITVLPSQNCLSSSNTNPGCCKTYSLSQVVSSTGSPLHLIKHSRMTMLLSFHSWNYNTSSGTSSSYPSSSNGGSSSDVPMNFPTAFLRQDTWNTL